MSVPNGLVLFHYPNSLFARRVVWYLKLRGIAYAECIQPPTMPREDLSALGVAYRRIPVLAIGRDMYCDTRLILRKLEEMFPDGALGAKANDQKSVERLLERWTIDAGIYLRAASLILLHLLNLDDPKFMKDREDYMGLPWKRDDIERGRPESLVYIRDGFELLETMLVDGRDWILKTEKPSLADIQAIWPFEWLVSFEGSLSPNVISEVQFPKVFAWFQRFRAAVKSAEISNPAPVALQGHEAVIHITNASLAENSERVDEYDPLGLEQGEEIEVWPVDTGLSHHDRGRLVTLTPDEVILASRTKNEGMEVHIHMPRWGFRIARVPAGRVADING